MSPGDQPEPTPSLLARLAELCRAEERHLYCVGGCVRDRILGLRAKDLDVAGDGAMALAREFASLTHSHFVPLDPEFGCARVIRRDRTEQIDFSELRGPDLGTDLALRDFTINAVACDVTDWLADRPTWIDPLGGLADLAAQRLRVCGPSSLADDPLRVLRAHRFAAALALRIDPETERQLQAVTPRLTEAAAERILAEWMALLSGAGCVAELSRMRRLGVLDALLPELPPAGEGWVATLEPYLAMARRALPDWMAEPEREARLRFAALVGDEPNGPSQDALIERFALSKAQRRAVATFRSPVANDSGPLRPTVASWLLEHRELGIGSWLVSAARGEIAASLLDEVLAVIDREVLPALRSKPWVSGADLKRLGVVPGPVFSEALDAARLGQVGGTAADPAAALAMAREVLVRDGRLD